MNALLALSLLTASTASAAHIEYTYGEKAVVIAVETIRSEGCEVASCGAYAYYEAVKNIDAIIAKTCKERGFRSYVIVETVRSGNETRELTTTALCK